MMKEKAIKKQKENPPLLGLATVAFFLIWGALFFYIPTYLGIDDKVAVLIFRVLGFIAIIISFVGSFIEISQLWKNEAFSYWGVSLVFVIPAVLLHFSIDYYDVSNPWAYVIKIFVLIFLFSGLPFVPFGFAHLLYKPQKNEKLVSEEEKADQTSKKVQLIASFIVAILSLITAIIQLVSNLGK